VRVISQPQSVQSHGVNNWIEKRATNRIIGLNTEQCKSDVVAVRNQAIRANDDHSLIESVEPFRLEYELIKALAIQ
jgi:hypothetical protein